MYVQNEYFIQGPTGPMKLSLYYIIIMIGDSRIPPALMTHSTI